MLLIAGRILYVTDCRGMLYVTDQEEYYTLLIAGGILYFTDSRRNIIRY
jgi:hypothetical protein